MVQQIKVNTLNAVVFVLSLLVSATGYAWLGPNVHSHGDNRGVYNRGGYYEGGGGYYYGRGWGGPNIVINVPAARPYIPVCNTMEVCDPYGECWLERYCD